ncbi:amidohydrolase [Facklamia sp. HMSC062C11]|uniref:M20 metallopeptidase family protein n=1 Tax=Facklamia sp. HMSC062C11 TaxID=1739262 RepID=UPI0008A2A56D|nr:M20 family metallopeptidase [Facklamia sp. HMSC062C11]OFL67068.1 amidohydrolase [Facklamia sp. HMSC062C11]
MDYLVRAKELLDDMVSNRRYLHQHPEIEFKLDNTVSFVKDKLKSYGIEAQDIGDHGVTAVLGDPSGKTYLLRADMDALPIQEATGLDYASKNQYMHACGHDIHTSMLLAAAKMLKENEANLKGQVKFIFQPAEELLVGGDAMIKAGILENPKVDAASGLHVVPNMPISGVMPGKNIGAAGAINFDIVVKGEGSHGASPVDGKDPVLAASQIVIGVQSMLTREIPHTRSATLTIGKFIAEGSYNVIPGKAELAGTIRFHNNETRDYIAERFPQLVKAIAQAYRCEAEVSFKCNCPTLVNDPAVADAANTYIRELSDNGQRFKYIPNPGTSLSGGSEDFAHYTYYVPSTFFYLFCPPKGVEKPKAVHHPEVQFDEDMMPVGAAALATIATRWLADNR